MDGRFVSSEEAIDGPTLLNESPGVWNSKEFKAAPPSPCSSSENNNSSSRQERQIVEHQPGILTLYSDGSFERPTDLNLPACPRFVNNVASMDVILNPSTRLWARLFLPQLLQHQNSSGSTMPVVLHFHGGGFCVGSPASRRYHEFCSRMAVQSRCICISVAYRLAPEHHLPAAYDDAFEALIWLRSQACAASGRDSSAAAVSWLAQHADFSQCFLAGESAGGNIVHFLAVRTAGYDCLPVQIRGLLVVHAAFTQAQSKPSADFSKLPPRVAFYHRSMLPGGTTPFDHPFLNPLHSDWPKFSEIELPPLFVAVAEKDDLRQGSEQYYDALTKAGKDAEFFASKHEGHCFHLFPTRNRAAELLEMSMIEFINKLRRKP